MLMGKLSVDVNMFLQAGWLDCVQGAQKDSLGCMEGRSDNPTTKRSRGQYKHFAHLKLWSCEECSCICLENVIYCRNKQSEETSF